MLLENLGVLDWIFLLSAIIGGSLFIVRIILMLAGMGEGGDVPDAGGDIAADVHVDVHVDADHGDAAHSHDSDSSFKILSLQGIMGFFLMFGTLGFTMSRIAGAGAVVSVISGTAAGLVTMWLTARLLKALLSLQSDGTIVIHNAIGKEGTVYQRILPGQTGKVQIVVQNRLVEYDAVADRDEELLTGTTVMAVYYKGNTLVVRKI